MEPLSIAVACVSLLSGLTTISTKIGSLITDVTEAHEEILALHNELDSCQRSLAIFYGSGDADHYPEQMQADLAKIIRECHNTVTEIDRTLGKVSGSKPGIGQRIQWSLSIRDEIARLHRNLEGHKSALSIAIAFATLSINQGIKSDTSSIRSKAARIPDIQKQLAAILQVLQASNGDRIGSQKLSVAMQRFLQGTEKQSLTNDSLSGAGHHDDPFGDQDIETIVPKDSQPKEPDEAYLSANKTCSSTFHH